MDIPKKLTFINETLHSLETDIIKEIPNMPEEWEELELRWFIEDRFYLDYGSFRDKRSKRYKAYQKVYLERML